MTGQDWTDFAFPEVFDGIQRGRRLKKADHTPGNVPYVSSTSLNNGVDGFIEEEAGTRAFEDCLSIANSGSVGTVFYEPFHYVASDHVTSLKREGASRNLYLFMAASASKQAVNFNFNREINDVRIRKLRLMLPADDDGQPDCESMEASVKERERCLLDRYLAYARQRLAECEFFMTGDFTHHVEDGSSELNLSDRDWMSFQAFGKEGLFKIKATRSGIDGIRIIQGENPTVPYVTRSDMNNGVSMFVSTDNDMELLDESGTISVGLDTQTAFYQPSQYLTGQNIHVVSGEHLTEGVAHFIVTLLRIQLRSKFNWGGNGATLGRMKRLKLMLPVDDEGKPDWDFMEQYTRRIMASKYRQYLDYIESAGRGQ